MGAHSRPRTSGALTVPIVAAVVLLGVGGAFAASALVRSDRATTALQRLNQGAGAAPAAASKTEQNSGESSNETVFTTADAAIAACNRQIALGEKVATVGAASAKNWSDHIQAYLLKESGEIGEDETARRYAVTHALGPRDEKAFEAALRDSISNGRACGFIGAAGTTQTTVRACLARADALDEVRNQATRVQNEWSSHMRQSAERPHTPAAIYHKRWVAMVAEGQKSLATFEKAQGKLAQTPKCA